MVWPATSALKDVTVQKAVQWGLAVQWRPLAKGWVYRTAASVSCARLVTTAAQQDWPHHQPCVGQVSLISSSVSVQGLPLACLDERHELGHIYACSLQHFFSKMSVAISRFLLSLRVKWTCSDWSGLWQCVSSWKLLSKWNICTKALSFRNIPKHHWG